MFTGIIEDQGTFAEISTVPDGRRLRILTELPDESIALGDSVAVDGVCLTVTEKTGDGFWADVSAETLAASKLGQARKGQWLHLERALSFGGRLGGHLVTGHVDGLGKLLSRRQVGQGLDLEFQAPEALLPYLVPKGSVAVDGVSLTVNRPNDDQFTVSLVPHTLRGTHLGELKVGDAVNLEADVLGKYVRHFVLGSKDGSGIDEDFLRQHGFL